MNVALASAPSLDAPHQRPSPLRAAYLQAIESRMLQILLPRLRPGIGRVDAFWSPLKAPDTAYLRATARFLDGKIEQKDLAQVAAALQQAWLRQIEQQDAGAFDEALAAVHSSTEPSRGEGGIAAPDKPW